MPELTFKSAGVSTREIDLSGPTIQGPQGVPACVIGTSLQGPAFVPITVATFSEYEKIFGATDGKKFGPLAVNEWLKNARSCTYIRVMGAGNCQRRNTTTGKVTNGGFVVGNQIIQENGNFGANTYANETVAASIKGRTYFLGCLMSESNGSTIFSSAGIQTSPSASVILRGVLMAPSGVVLSLSGNSTALGNIPNKTQTAVSANTVVIGRTGAMTGSLTLANQQFVMLLNGFNRKNGTPNILTASFDMTSPSYFAKVFNREPLKIEEKGHLLYTHYDIYPTYADVTGSDMLRSGFSSTGISDDSIEDIAFLVTSSLGRSPADSASPNIPNYENFEDRFRYASTPYVISQNFGGSGHNLFKIVYLSPGVEGNTKIKISIENLKKSTSTAYLYGSFDLIIRDFYDTDQDKVILESFRGLSLDPDSDRFAPRVIGDQNIYFAFDNAVSAQKILVTGDYPVRSNYIRLEQSSKLSSDQVPAEALPVGYRGPSHLVTSGSLLATEADTNYILEPLQQMVEPPIPYRETVALGTGIRKRDDSRLYWGSQFTRKTSLTEPNKAGLFEESFESYVKYFPRFNLDRTKMSVGDNVGAADVAGSILDSDRFDNNIFSLERIQVRTGSTSDGGYADTEYWMSASYVRDGVIAASPANKTRAWQVSDLERVGNRTYSKFTFFLQGGFDGSNVFNKDQQGLTNTSAKREMDFSSDQGGTSGPTVAAYRKAVDIMESKADVDVQLLAIPGMRHSSITDFAITAVENRFDAMYIMDVEERDQFNTVITGSGQRPNVLYTVNAFKGRALDSSFAAAYFPDMIVVDPTTQGNVQVPPSVPVLGAFGLNDQIGHPWFAPAGFSRGALDSVELAAVRLNRTNLDDLYEADINPLTAFPGTGVVVWGQKTLLAKPSALDRVNVRRLLINVRRQVRNVANSLLFEPNREETLEKFTALVNPILQRIQEQSGVDRYKVIIDTTTTTQADVENNTIRGKIFLQPTRTAEFIALDFVVTNAGANI